MKTSKIPSRASMLKKADRMAYAMKDERLTPEQREQAKQAHRKLTIIAELMKGRD